MSDQEERCPECGSWGEECLSETPQQDCGCARCLRAFNTALRSEWERSKAAHAVTKKELITARVEAEMLREELERARFKHARLTERL